jgi:hypothetical protein
MPETSLARTMPNLPNRVGTLGTVYARAKSSAEDLVTGTNIKTGADQDLAILGNVNLNLWQHLPQQSFQFVNGVCIVESGSEGEIVGLHGDLVAGDR